jgi:hypothetical protein
MDGLWAKGEATYRNDEMQIVGSLLAPAREETAPRCHFAIAVEARPGLISCACEGE